MKGELKHRIKGILLILITTILIGFYFSSDSIQTYRTKYDKIGYVMGVLPIIKYNKSKNLFIESLLTIGFLINLFYLGKGICMYGNSYHESYMEQIYGRKIKENTWEKEITMKQKPN